MIPVLYSRDELTFTTNGIGRLVDTVSCVVTEELNGIFELEMSYPVNGKYYPQIQSGGIIGVVYNGKLQPFDINKLSVDETGLCKVNASHVSNRTAFAWIGGGRNYQTLDQMIYTLNHSGQVPYAYNFVYSTDIVSTGTIYSELKECAKSLVSRLAVAFQGEIEYDVWDVKILSRRGTDTNLNVAYGKNVENIEREVDWSETWNAICPYWDSGTASNSPYTPSDAIQTVPQTPVIPKYVNFYEVIDHYPTQQELYDAGVAYMNSNQPWIPSDSVQSVVIQVADDDPTKDLRIGDTLNVVFTQAGTSLTNARVVGIEYNVLLERNNTITVGTPQKEYVEVSGLDTDEPKFITPADLNTRLTYYPTKTEINSLFSVSTVSHSITVAANNANDITLTGTKSGYYPIGVVGVDSQSTGSASAIIKDCYISASGDGTVSVYMQVRNISSSQYTGTVVAYVLWRKSL